MDKRPIQFGYTCIQRIFILGNKEGNPWPFPGRSPSKQATEREFETTWLLRSTTHTRDVEAQKKTNPFLTNRGCLWYKVYGKEHVIHLYTCLRKHYDKVTTDWKGELYAGINLKWNYEKC